MNEMYLKRKQRRIPLSTIDLLLANNRRTRVYLRFQTLSMEGFH